MVFWVKITKKNEKFCLFMSHFSFFPPIHLQSSPRPHGGVYFWKIYTPDFFHFPKLNRIENWIKCDIVSIVNSFWDTLFSSNLYLQGGRLSKYEEIQDQGRNDRRWSREKEYEFEDICFLNCIFHVLVFKCMMFRRIIIMDRPYNQSAIKKN